MPELDENMINIPRAGRVELSHEERSSCAEVNDNGRIDIRLEEDARLSLEFMQTVRARLANASDNERKGSKSSYEYSGAFDISSQPRISLNIVIQIVGSRGDVQPFIALGKTLQTEYGHRVRIATHQTFKGFVEEHELEFFNIGGDPTELMAFMVKNPGLMPGKQALSEGQIGQRRKVMIEILQRAWRSCFEPGTGVNDDFDRSSKPFVADAIIANPPSFAHIHCAERLGVPLHMMFTMPWSPTRSFAHPLSNLQVAGIDLEFANYLTYSIVELLTWQGLGDLINYFREITLGLQPLTAISGPGVVSRLQIPYTYCWSSTLIPKPLDWDDHINVCGFIFLDQSTSYQPSPDLEEFLNSGPPPVYIGFGSIVIDNPEKLTQTIFDAVQKCGVRALVSKGWGELGKNVSKPASVLMLDNVPHDWLFARVSCVVHHGGAGTSAAGISAGKPTVIVPFFGDQPFWGSMIAKAGAGPQPIPYSKLTTENLCEAIQKALQPNMMIKAKSMAKAISRENGSKASAQSFQASLSLEQIRCSIIAKNKAVWKLGRSDIKLSPLVAKVLTNAGEVKTEDLRLFRSHEHTVAQGPLEPFSGGASALLGTIGTLMGGVSDIPVGFFRSFEQLFKRRANDQLISRSELQSNQTTDTAPLATNLSLQSSIEVGKGAVKIIGAGLRSPMEFTTALASGFHNAPRLYGDTTVREQPKITDFSDGIKAATLGLGQGFYDGISGLFRHPAREVREHGLGGLAKGLGKAIGGVILKPAAGVWGVPGYLSQGVWQELRKSIAIRSDAGIIASRLLEGEIAFQSCSYKERSAILEKWKLFKLEADVGQNDRVTVPSSMLQTSGGIKTTDRSVAAAVQEISRGNRSEDDLITRLLEAQLAQAERSRSSVVMDDSSSTFSTSTHRTEDLPHNVIELTDYEDDESRTWHLGTDDPQVESDEDENMERALQRSLHET